MFNTPIDRRGGSRRSRKLATVLRVIAGLGACAAFAPTAPARAAGPVTTQPALLEVFDEGLTSGAHWESPDVVEGRPFRDVRDDGGDAGQHWAYLDRNAQLGISGLAARIREHPGAGEYRYVSFAVRKWGGGDIAVHFDHEQAASEAKGVAVDYRYDLGHADKIGVAALRIGDLTSEGWTEVTRDLWQDFGDFTLTGITAQTIGGRDGGVDRIYLAQTQDDLKKMIPTARQLDQANGGEQQADVAPPAFRAIAMQAPPAVTPAGPNSNIATPSISTTSPAASNLPTPTPTPTANATAAPSDDSAAAAAAPAAEHGVSWGGKLKEAGKTGLLQLLLSIFGGVFAFERFFRLRQRYIVPNGLAERARRLWAAGDFAALEQLKETHPSTLARVISFIAANRDAPMNEVSQISGELVSRELDIHYRKAYPLGVVATIAPLLGLLGMILGMIQTFEIVSTAGSLGDPTQLASGISEALVTTALGLAIAIPFLILYHFFKHRTAGFGVQLEEQVTSLTTQWLLHKRRGAASGSALRVASHDKEEAECV